VFEISVTREFERWYEALDAAAAEKVAAELNLLERLGPELDALRASRLLLWFDGLQGGGLETLQLQVSREQLGRLLQHQQEALRCLETPNFLARFLKLEPRQARHGHELIERLRACVRAASMQLLLRQGSIGAAAAPALPQASSLQTVQQALLDVLAFVGLRREDVADTSSGLRELTLGELTPPCRLLYAIDSPRRRILAILGEALDRAYYGDSVRLAERRWRDYCRSLQLASP
jgi:hypothetical protein